MTYAYLPNQSYWTNNNYEITAYRKGYFSRTNNRSTTKNPYLGLTLLTFIWHAGWNDANNKIKESLA